MLGNLNLWVEDRTKVGITYGFSGARENWKEMEKYHGVK